MTPRPIHEYGGLGHDGPDPEAECRTPDHWDVLPFDDLPIQTQRLMLEGLGWSPEDVALAAPEETE
jgi:hypothetical protein